MGYDLEGYNKFIPYYLFPHSTYTVSGQHVELPHQGLGRIEPVVPGAREIQPGEICERYGGGGHPKVGAISFPIGAVEQARQAAHEIAAELRS